MSDILNSPCIFCGYSGKNYWQADSHDKSCPWHKVGGALERATLIRKIEKLSNPRLVSYEPSSHKTCTLNINGEEYYYTLNSYTVGENLANERNNNILQDELHKASQEIDRLKKIIECDFQTLEYGSSILDRYEKINKNKDTRITELKQENQRLRGALKPFARFACSPKGECDCNNCKARDVLAQNKE